MASTLSRSIKRFQVYERHGMIIFKERNEKGNLTNEIAISRTGIKEIRPNQEWPYDTPRDGKQLKALLVVIEGNDKTLGDFEDCIYTETHFTPTDTNYWFTGEAERAIYNFYFGES